MDPVTEGYEPLFCISVKRKAEERRTKTKKWGPFSYEYIPWKEQKIIEKAVSIFIIAACLFVVFMIVT